MVTLATHFPAWSWIVLFLTIGSLLTIDLYGHRRGHGVTRNAAITWSVIWVGAGLLFNLFIALAFGSVAAQEYLATYLIEKSLSVDNLFVFMIIFRGLKIPEALQPNVLLWGIFGALIFRAIFIALGAAALERWYWISWIFGGLLLFTAWNVLREDKANKSESRFVSWLSRKLPFTPQLHDRSLFIRRLGKPVATPLFLALVAIETSDILFAIDSVPAALAVTRRIYIVYSSNAFAILGLRSLYVLMASSLGELPYLHYGLAAVLALAGIKLILGEWIEGPPLLSVLLIVAIMGIAIGASAWKTRRQK